MNDVQLYNAVKDRYESNKDREGHWDVNVRDGEDKAIATVRFNGTELWTTFNAKWVKTVGGKRINANPNSVLLVTDLRGGKVVHDPDTKVYGVRWFRGILNQICQS